VRNSTSGNRNRNKVRQRARCVDPLIFLPFAPEAEEVQDIAMDAFEHIAARLFEVRGYWTRIGYAVKLSKEQKVAVGQPSLPRPQLDVIAYKPNTNELLVIECKSYLDSPGVMHAAFHGSEDAQGDLYKLFNRVKLREMVLSCLVTQLRQEGLIIGADPSVKLVLVAGKIYSKDEQKLKSLFEEKGWTFVGPTEVAVGLREFADRGYENDVVTIVTKLLERNPSSASRE